MSKKRLEYFDCQTNTTNSLIDHSLFVRRRVVLIHQRNLEYTWCPSFTTKFQISFRSNWEMLWAERRKNNATNDTVIFTVTVSTATALLSWDSYLEWHWTHESMQPEPSNISTSSCLAWLSEYSLLLGLMIRLARGARGRRILVWLLPTIVTMRDMSDLRSLVTDGTGGNGRRDVGMPDD